MNKLIIIFTFLCLMAPCYSQSSAPADTNAVDTNNNQVQTEYLGDDNIARSYRILSRPGGYEDKKNAIKFFQENYQSPRVQSIIIDLLIHSYENIDFKENDQTMYYDDVIAAELIKILGQSGTKDAFPALLRVVINSRLHRDLTIKEAWKAIQAIKW